MVDDTTKDLLLALIAGIPAIILAYAAYKKAVLTVNDIQSMKKRLTDLEAENRSLKQQLSNLTDENNELREQNRALTAINEEYRTKLLIAVDHRATPRRNGD